jgi:hypothetical protein
MPAVGEEYVIGNWGAFWGFPARLRRFQHWKVEAEEFEAGGEELPTEKVGNSPSLNFALAGLPAVTARHCYLIFSKFL